MNLDQSLLADRYELEDLIGSGGMADVYRGTDRVLLRPVAIKLLRDVSDPTKRERFVQEARTLASLNHAGLVTLLDAGIEGERPYLVMELAEGLTLSQRLDDGPLSSDEVRVIGAQLAAALQYAHDRGIVHRDVKPSNVLLTEERPLLVDFGIARLIGSTEQQTRTGDTIGSPPYLAPEQVSADPITTKADVYSFGLVLLEALTGVRAFTGTPVEAAVARLSTPPVFPTSLDPVWRDVLMAMTHLDPDERPTAGEVADVLGDSSGPPVVGYDDTQATAALVLPPDVLLAASDVPPDDVPPDDVRRSRRVLPAVLTLVLALAVGAAFLVAQNRSTETDPVTEQQVSIPAGVPAGMRPPLLALHRAVDAVADDAPRLTADLGKVDTALSTGRFPLAERELQDLADAARDYKDDELISTAENRRIQTPVRKLLDLVAARTSEAEPSGESSTEEESPDRPSPARPTATEAEPTTGTTQAPPPEPAPTSAPTSAPPPSDGPTGADPGAVEPRDGATPTP